MNIEFNRKGVPLMFWGNGIHGHTGGTPSNAMTKQEQKKVTQTVDEKDTDYLTLDSYKIVLWRSQNDFPQWADKLITSTGVLNTGLKFLRNLTIGQGIYACTVDGYDDKGNEILNPYPDKAVQQQLLSRPIRRYLEKALRDYLKFGAGAVQFIPNEQGNQIVGVNPLNAYYWRLTKRKDDGREYCIVSGKWPETPATKDYQEFDVLLEYDPEMDLDIRRYESKATKSPVMLIRDSWSNKETYSEPIWLGCYLAGWLDIAKKVPLYLQTVYKNQATWKWHIQIPYTFWDKKFPETNYSSDQEGTKKREDDIQRYMDDIEDNLLGAKNAEKPLFTHYAVNDLNQKVEEEWKITALDNKSKEGDKLVTSAAANSEILFSLMINPNVMGAGMPGGAYAGNQGGSNIREAFLVNIANAWIDRQNILDPIEIMLRYNGYKDVELRFRNTILTTLDSGSGTTKNLS